MKPHTLEIPGMYRLNILLLHSANTRVKYYCICFSSSTNAKPQFGPWLIEQVESGQYEGLSMIGDDIFRIPWKHNARRDLGDVDVKIFKVTSSMHDNHLS